MKFKTIFSFWFLWRAGSFLISVLAIIILPNFGNKFPYVNEMLKNSGLPAWFWQSGNFDGVHYVGIAKDGYIRQFTQAFFPVYPMMIKIISPIFFNNFVFAGVFLSSVFTLLAAWMLRNLLIINDLNHSLQRKNIKWALLFFLFFPMSFFYGSIYNESFFLFLVFSVFYFAKKRNWLTVGILGALASGTRLVGIFLLPTILYAFIVGTPLQTTRYKIQNIAYIFLIPLGFLIYILFLQINFGDALYFLHAQSAFGASRSTGIVLPIVTFWRYVKILTTVPVFQYNFWVAVWEAGFFATGGVILAILSWMKIKNKDGIKGVGSSYLIFSWFCLLLPTLTGTLSSFPRYLLICFPIYIFLGSLPNKFVKLSILFLFLILNFIFSTLFLRGYWVS